MNKQLLSLAFAPFAFGTSAFAFIGLLVPMANGLDVSVPVVGQLQTVFAIACAVGGPVLAHLLARVERKRLLLTVMGVVLLMNVASMLAPDFSSLMATRILGGLFTALTLPVASGIAVMLVPEAKRPTALAIVLSGYTLAFLIGMPIATLLGETYGWRAAFGFSAGITVLSLGVLALGTPANVMASQVAGMSFTSAMQGQNPRLVLATMMGFCATFSTVSFIAPVITAFSGVEGAAIGGIQIATGVGSLLGLPAGAALARLTVSQALGVLFTVMIITQSAFSLGMHFSLGALSVPVLVVVMTCGSGALFAMSPVIQTALAKAAGTSATLAFAINGSMLYLGQGFGAGLGGLVYGSTSIIWVGCAGACVAALGLLIAGSLSQPRLSQ